ncbi:chromate reductase [Duganella sp. 3397]|uniref:NADPH azoreductase n=1 Tax=Duganella phyllosphaerae TaxID=762836 RepID=A0A1E7WJK6_9BURK|nr:MULTISPECIES: NAD(P)H-dependent oxidoreductase [Duganella]MDR7052447.1 chromate reductase [Duganella sp. 3397]OEZ98862.1 NADPH azoreductase [Duganella phyllosphaerae]
MPAKKIAVIIGSLRKDSINRKFAHEVIALAPESLNLEIVEIGELAIYNQDLEENGAVPPQAWTQFRERMQEFEGVLFFTPEYNRSTTAALKNALDVGSRPYGSSVWTGKPAGVVSITPGATGAFGANHHLRQSLVFLDMPVLQQPEMYIGSAAKLLGDDGKVNNEDTKKFLKKFIDTYAVWVETNAKK